MADVIFVNGRIYTLNNNSPSVEIIAVKEGKIVYIGSDKNEIANLRGENTKIFDLKNQVVLPGFVESHNHFNAVANQFGWVDVGITKCAAISDVLATIQNAVNSETERKEPLQWIKCVGYDDTLIEEQRDLTRDDLDKVTGDFPIWVWHPSMHRAYCNSKALEISGVNEATFVNPDGGFFTKDANGRLTGQMDEMPAYQIIYQHLNKTLDPASKRGDMWNAARYFASKGVTSIQDLFVGPLLFLLYKNAFAVHTKDNPFPIRVSVYSPPNWADRPESTGFDPLYLRFSGTKLFADGSIQCHTACCINPYTDEPSCNGSLNFAIPQLNEIILKLHASGRQIAVHCNGDGAVEAFLNAVEAAVGKFPRENHRHRIEHCQIVSEEQLARMSKLGVVASFFIGHVYYWGDRHHNKFLGPERAKRISPLKSALNAKIPFGLHCDCPITPVDPLHSIWCAVARRTKTNFELGEDQRITVEQAIRAYTIDAAYINFEEDIKGTLELGKLADFIVLSADPYEVPVDEIPKISVLQTFVGGNLSHGEVLPAAKL